MAIIKDKGFILRTFDFRETSKIVHIFTKKLGKVHGVLKGFRRGKKEFTTSLDSFSLNEFIFYQSRNPLWLVSSA
ncbi:MAG TPA: DNA repair protein RecO, partial [Candidatus Omnitrophica bacterium]|nr:DNA repair protein RecO [Candidatus Omnitrophota bacterium]